MKRFLLVILSIFAVGSSSLIFAHGGGLNKDGCHNNRKTGEYHCHRSNPASNVSPTQVKSVQRDDTCHTGPRGGRYRIVNGKKRYGC